MDKSPWTDGSLWRDAEGHNVAERSWTLWQWPTIMRHCSSRRCRMPVNFAVIADDNVVLQALQLAALQHYKLMVLQLAVLQELQLAAL